MNNFKNKEKFALFAIIGLIAVTLIAGTYGFLRMEIYGNDIHNVVAGTFNIDYEDGEYINIDKAVPLSDDKGMTTTEYNFTVSNTGNVDAKYKLYIEDNPDVKPEEKLSPSQIKYSLKKGAEEWSAPALLSTLPSASIIDEEQFLAAPKDKETSSINYSLRIWVDENVGNEAQNKTWSGKIVVDAIQGDATIDNFKTNVGPVIILDGKTVETVESGSDYTDPGIKSITDDKDVLNAEDAEITYSYYDGDTTTSVPKVDTEKVGVYYITYKISDSDGNEGIAVRTVNVYKKNTVPPTIELIGPEEIELMTGDPFEDQGATAHDDQEGDISFRIVTVGKVNTKVPGTYIIKYLVEDQEGNTASVTRKVIVKDVQVVTVTFVPKDNVVSVGQQKATCDIPRGEESCQVTLPTIESKTGFDEKLWYDTESDAGEGKAPETKVTVTEDTTYYAYAHDITAPVCKFVSAEPNPVNKEGSLTVTVDCTDTSGTVLDELDAYDLDINVGGKTENDLTRGMGTEDIENGLRYTFTLSNFSTGGDLSITIPQDKVKDESGNGNESTTLNTSVVVNNPITVTVVRSTGVSKVGSSTEEEEHFTCNLTGNNKSCNIDLPTLTADSGYDGAIYASSTSGDVPRYNPGSNTFTGNVTLYAVGYKNHKLTLKKDASVTSIDGKTDSSIELQCQAYGNGSCTIELPDIEVDTDSGYVSGFWSKSSSENDRKYPPKESYTMTGDDTLTAYGLITRSLSFNFVSNSGVSSIGSYTETCQAYGTDSCTVKAPSITVTSATPAYTGKWYVNQNPSSSTTSYSPNASITVTAAMSASHVTYYAYGTRTLTLTITPSTGVSTINGSSSAYKGTCNQIGTASCSVTLPDAVQASGYEGVGYAKGTSTSYSRYFPKGSYSLSSDDTLNAYGYMNRYLNLAIASNASTVTAIGAEQISCVGFGTDSCTATFPTITTSSGSGKWVSSESATSGGYNPGAAISITTSISGNTYYATSVKTYTLTINIKTGIDNISGQTSSWSTSCSAYGNNNCTVYYPSSSSIAVSSGYTGFLITSSNTAASSGTTYNAGSSRNLTASVTNYIFGGQTLTLTIHRQSGISQINSSTSNPYTTTCVRYGTQSCSISLPSLTVSDTTTYNGGGVYSAQSNQANVGSYTTYTSGNNYSISADSDLYAYGKKDITVSYTYYTSQIASITKSSDTCTAYGTASCSFNLPTATLQADNDSYDFVTAYWYNQTGNTASSAGKANGASISVTSSTTWRALASKKNQVSIDFNNSVTAIAGSSSNPYTLSCTAYGSSHCTVTLPSTVTAVSGFTFQHFGTTENATTGNALGSSYTVKYKDEKLYAIATKTLTVRFYNKDTNAISTLDNTSLTSTSTYLTKTCTLYGGDTYCTMTLPTVGFKSTSYTVARFFSGNISYVAYTSSTSAYTPGNNITIYSSNGTTQYYSAFARTTVYAHVRRTSAVTAPTADSNPSCYKYGSNNANSTCQVTLPSITANTNSGYSGPFYADSTTSDTSLAASGATINISADDYYYASASKNLYVRVSLRSAYSTYGAATLTGNSSQTGGTSGTIGSGYSPTNGYRYSNCHIYGDSTECSVTLPTATAYTSSGFSNVAYSTSSSSTAVSSSNVVSYPGYSFKLSTSDTSSTGYLGTTTTYMTLYAVGYTTLTGRFSKSYDSNVSSIGATSRTCTKYASGTCSITLPTISVANGYSAGKWFSNTDLGTSSYPTSVSATYISYGKSANSSQNISQDTYYSAFAGSTVTITITKTAAVTTASTTRSCTRYGSGSCNVTLPTLTAATNYSSPFFASTKTGSASKGASGATVSVSANATWYSSASRNLYISVTKYSQYSTYGVSTLTGYTTNSGTSSSAVAQSSQGTRYAHCLIYGDGTSCSTTAPTATAYTGFSSVVFASTTSASSITSTNSFAQGSTITIKTSGTASGTSVLANSTYYAWGTKTNTANFYYYKTYGSCNSSSCSASTQDTSASRSCTTYGNNSCNVSAPNVYPYKTNGYDVAYWATTTSATSGLNSGASISISSSATYYGVGYRDLSVTFTGSTGVTVLRYNQFTCRAYGSQSSCTVTIPGTNDLSFAANYGPPAWYSTTNGASSGTTLGTNSTSMTKNYNTGKTTAYYVMATYSDPVPSTLSEYLMYYASATTGETNWNSTLNTVQKKQRAMAVVPINSDYLNPSPPQYYFVGDMPDNYIYYNGDEVWKVLGVRYEYSQARNSYVYTTKIIRTASVGNSSFGTANFFSSTARATLHGWYNGRASYMSRKFTVRLRSCNKSDDNYTYNTAWQCENSNSLTNAAMGDPVAISNITDYMGTYMEGYSGGSFNSLYSKSIPKASWMTSFVANSWVMATNSSYGSAMKINNPAMDDEYTNYSAGIVPVMYLEPETIRSSGTGGSGSPFRIA